MQISRRRRKVNDYFSVYTILNNEKRPLISERALCSILPSYDTRELKNFCGRATALLHHALIWPEVVALHIVDVRYAAPAIMQATGVL